MVVGHADTLRLAGLQRPPVGAPGEGRWPTPWSGAGVSQTALSVDWKGETQPAVATGDGVKEPLNRRSTIDINF